MKKFFAFLTVAVVLLAVSAEAAERIVCPERNVGTAYEFAVASNPSRPNFRLSIVAKEGDLLQVESSSGSKRTRDVMFNIRQKDGTFYLATPRCPFALGDTQTDNVNYVHGASGAEITAKQTVTVGGAWESVTVPAGTFKVVKVVMVQNFEWFNPKNNSRGTGVVTETSYYAPEIGTRVSYAVDSKPSQGQHTYNAFELVAYDIRK